MEPFFLRTTGEQTLLSLTGTLMATARCHSPDFLILSENYGQNGTG